MIWLLYLPSLNYQLNQYIYYVFKNNFDLCNSEIDYSGILILCHKYKNYNEQIYYKNL